MRGAVRTVHGSGVRAGYGAFLAVVWLFALERLAAPVFGETRPVLTALEASILIGAAAAAARGRGRPAGSWWTVSVLMCLGPVAFTVLARTLPADLLTAPAAQALAAFGLCLIAGGSVAYAIGRVCLGDLVTADGVLGAVVGAGVALCAAPFALLPLAGTRATLAVAATLAGVAGLRRGLAAGAAGRIAVALAALSGAVVLAAGGQGPRRAQAQSSEGVVRVWQSGADTVLSTGSGAAEQSLVRRGEAVTGTYTDDLALAPYAAALSVHRPLRVLVLGLGGGGIVHTWRAVGLDPRTLAVTGAEVDPAVITAARRHFGLDRLAVRVRIGDGRVLLRADRGRYDAVVVDAYSHEAYLPFALSTIEFARLVRAHLRPGGSVWLNLNVTDPHDPLPTSVEATYRRVFPVVAAARVAGRWNRIVVAGPTGTSVVLNRMAARPAAMGVAAALEPVARSLRWRVVPDAALQGARVWTDDRADPEGAVDAAIWRGILGKRPV